jgi:signal transduction histidine kinase
VVGPDPAVLAVELPVPVVTVDRGGTVTFANASLSRLVDDEAPQGRLLDEVLGLPGAYAALAEQATDPSSPHADLSCRTADGRALLLAAVGRMLEDGSVLAVLTDETETRAAASQHADQTQALRLLAEFPEKNPGPVGRIARDGTVVMANAAARSFLGEDEIRGRSWIDLCPGMTPELWERILASGGRITHEADRSGICILFTHVVADAGDLVFVYGADVTARREDERLLAQQAAQLAEVARFPEMNPGPVLRMGPDANVLMANAAARLVFGENLVGRSWLDLCPGVDTVLWKEYEAAEDVRFHEARIGERSFVFAHRWDVQTRLMFVFGADVSAQKAAERALRQSERMATLGTLAAGVAHELNNPAAAAGRAADQLVTTFTALQLARQRLDDAGLPPEGWRILGTLEERAREQAGTPSELSTIERSDREAELEDWLDDHGVDEAWDLAPGLVAQGLIAGDLDAIADSLAPELLGTGLRWATAAHGVHRLAREIGQGTGRISEIVQAMKSYSYLGQAPVQAVDVHEGLDSTLVILRNKLKQGIEVRREYDRSLPAVAAHGSELNQVWTNLLDNAADAMGGRGTITIRTSQDGDTVMVEVVDDGPGIPDEIQHQVFDPFFTTKEPGKGTGLGLSTSYSIVTEKHHGTMTVTSRPGSTTFTVRLPIDAPSEVAREDS